MSSDLNKIQPQSDASVPAKPTQRTRDIPTSYSCSTCYFFAEHTCDTNWCGGCPSWRKK